MARLAAGSAMPSLAALMTAASAVLMRGLAANFAGKGARQVGHVFLPWATPAIEAAQAEVVLAWCLQQTLVIRNCCYLAKQITKAMPVKTEMVNGLDGPDVELSFKADGAYHQQPQCL